VPTLRGRLSSSLVGGVLYSLLAGCALGGPPELPPTRRQRVRSGPRPPGAGGGTDECDHVREGKEAAESKQEPRVSACGVLRVIGRSRRRSHHLPRRWFLRGHQYPREMAKLQPPNDDDAPASAGHWQAALRSQRGPALISLRLSSRELMVAKLFADGHSADEIGLSLGLSPETVRAYLVHVRLKYKNAGRDASTKLRLRALLIADRLLSE